MFADRTEASAGSSATCCPSELSAQNHQGLVRHRVLQPARAGFRRRMVGPRRRSRHMSTPEALRRTWLEDEEPDARTYLLLQRAGLADNRAEVEPASPTSTDKQITASQRGPCLRPLQFVEGQSGVPGKGLGRAGLQQHCAVGEQSLQSFGQCDRHQLHSSAHVQADPAGERSGGRSVGRRGGSEAALQAFPCRGPPRCAGPRLAEDQQMPGPVARCRRARRRDHR